MVAYIPTIGCLMFNLDQLNSVGHRLLILTDFKIIIFWSQWFCYLGVLHPGHIKIPKDK